MSSIVVRCDDCGQGLRISAEHAGRQLRCPKCRHVQVVPEASAAPPLMPPPAPQHVGTEPPPAPPVAVPPDAPGVQLAPSAPSATEPAGATVRRRRSISWRKLAIPLVVLFLLLVGGAGAWWWLTSGTANDLKLVPSDAAGFVTVRPADLLDSHWVKRIRKEMGRGDFDDGIEETAERLGFFFDVEECERLTVYVDELDEYLRQEDLVFIVRMQKSFDGEKLLERFEKEWNDDETSEQTEHKGKVYYVTEHGQALYFHTNRIFAFGPEEGIERSIRAALADNDKGRLSEPKKLASRSRYHFVAGFNGKFTRNLHETLDGARVGANLHLILQKIVGVEPEDLHHSFITLELDKDVTLTVCGQYKNAEVGQTIVDAVHDQLKKVDEQFEEIEDQERMPKSVKRQMRLMRKTLEDIKIDNDDGRVEAEFRIKEELIEELIDD